MVGHANEIRAITIHDKNVQIPLLGTCRREGDAIPVRRPLRFLVEPVAGRADAANRAGAEVDPVDAGRPFTVALEHDLALQAGWKGAHGLWYSRVGGVHGVG
ncbi:MAG: hypothetical protein LC791_06470 [Acidobacteria bacterium]|nr:hypothetical protein [Acidobacteriota bacterium]